MAGFGKAIEIANDKINDDFEHAKGLKEYILNKISSLENTIINSQQESGLPNIINVSFIGVDSATLITSLQNDVAISSGSACTSGSIEPSHVLRGMGIEGDRLNSAVRISFGRYTSKEDIDIALTKITDEVIRIRNYLN